MQNGKRAKHLHKIRNSPADPHNPEWFVDHCISLTHWPPPIYSTGRQSIQHIFIREKKKTPRSTVVEVEKSRKLRERADTQATAVARESHRSEQYSGLGHGRDMADGSGCGHQSRAMTGYDANANATAAAVTAHATASGRDEPQDYTVAQETNNPGPMSTTTETTQHQEQDDAEEPDGLDVDGERVSIIIKPVSSAEHKLLYDCNFEDRES